MNQGREQYSDGFVPSHQCSKASADIVDVGRCGSSGSATVGSLLVAAIIATSAAGTISISLTGQPTSVRQIACASPTVVRAVPVSATAAPTNSLFMFSPASPSTP
jgi:hypothetical protein